MAGRSRKPGAKKLGSAGPAAAARPGAVAAAAAAAVTAAADAPSAADPPPPAADGLRIIYVHGIGNKPPAGTLKRHWDHALFGRDMGARTRMAYWADLRYAQPLAGGEIEGMGVPGADAFFPTTDDQFRTEIEQAVRAAAAGGLLPSGSEKRAIRYGVSLAARIAGQRSARQRVASGGSFSVRGTRMKVLPVPRWARQWLTERVTRLLIRDTAAYFFDPEQRAQIQARFRQLVVPGAGPYVVVAHSQGSIVAYDVLRGLAGDSGVRVPLLVTIGSPLGLQEVQDQIGGPLRGPACVARWRNFADVLDPVALDKGLAGDFEAPPEVEDGLVVNRDSLRLRGFNPHSGTGYLATGDVREAVRAAVPASMMAPLSEFVVASDVARGMADLRERLPVLIELDDAIPGAELDAKRAALEQDLRDVVGDADAWEHDVRFERLRHYVAAHLTAAEIENVAARHVRLGISRVWRNSRKRALIHRTAHTLQTYTARGAYLATGAKVAWAVLDTGIRRDHPHFAKHANVAAVWDCHLPGPPRQNDNVRGNDGHGHGTHVAGIVAGQGPSPEFAEHRGMAPESRLHVYKVLDDEGSGEDAWIIKALDHIAEMNDRAPSLVVHGVNLSLGGPYDAEVFGCGHSPICRELRRLWRQGVVVCVAAGNEGRTVVDTPDGEQEISLDLSIGDPANLEEAIAVGSVHRDQPHMYGISYFSSRGPTADGRPKPDLVAPGEKIVSCNAGSGTGTPNPLYVPMSGTSMACPAVSGLIAAFLSARREFIGHPDRVKQIVLAHATSLGRDRYHQGAGMPNLVKMLADT